MVTLKQLTRVALLVVLLFSSAFLHSEASAQQQEYIITGGLTDGLTQYLHETHKDSMKSFPSFGMMSITVTPEEHDLLIQQFPNIEVQKSQIYERNANNKLKSLTIVRADESMTNPYSGKGVKVAVLDSGIDLKHRDLKVKKGYCSLAFNCTYGVEYDDDNGHGTHVAGIISANNPKKNIRGIAPQADLYSIKALDAFGYGTTASLIDGVEWAIKNKVDILNMSVTTDNDDQALKKVLDQAYQSGMLIVAAVGNNGHKPDKSVRFPAKYESVIAVSAVTNSLKRMNDSAMGPEVEIAAPGEAVYSTYPLSHDYFDDKVDGYSILSGTSMATPHVTGILALYKERFPQKTNDELRKLLRENAKDLGEKGKDSSFGYGLVQYQNIFSDTVKLTVGQEVGRLKLSTTQNDTTIQVGGKTLPKRDNAWTVYGVEGYKEVLVKSGNTFEKQFIKINQPKFQDVHNQQVAAEAIGFMSHQKQIEGFKDGTFRPYQSITRAEAAVLVGRALGLSSKQTTTKFNDVAPTSFASGYIDAATKANIISGFSDGTFRPEARMTRAEMAILISKAFTLQTYEQKSFKDVSPTMASYEAIQKLSAAKITTGYNDQTFKPYDAMTRSDFALFLARVQEDYFK